MLVAVASDAASASHVGDGTPTRLKSAIYRQTSVVVGAESLGISHCAGYRACDMKSPSRWQCLSQGDVELTNIVDVDRNALDSIGDDVETARWRSVLMFTCQGPGE